MSEAEDTSSGVSKTSEETEDKRSGKRLTDAEWAEIVENFELGLMGIVELANKYGVSRQALSQRFKTNGIRGGSRTHEIREAVNQAAKQHAAASVPAERFIDRRAEWIEETRMQGYAALKQAQMMTVKKVIDTHKAGNSMSSIDDELKALRRYQQILVENIDSRLGSILSANDSVDETNLPALILEDLTASEIIEHHKEIGALDEDTDIDELLKSVDQDLSGMTS